LEDGRQSYIEYEGLGIQGTTSKEVSGLIYRSIYNQGGGIYQCSQIMTANLDKNPSSCEC